MSPRPKRFLGKSEHPVDPKGRMSLSKQFHGALDRDDEGRPRLARERAAEERRQRGAAEGDVAAVGGERGDAAAKVQQGGVDP